MVSTKFTIVVVNAVSIPGATTCCSTLCASVTACAGDSNNYPDELLRQRVARAGPVVEVNASDVVTAQQGVIVTLVAGIKRAAGVEHHSVPGVDGSVVTQIEEEFGEEACVEFGVGLKLDLDKEHRPGGLVGGREEDAIKAKGSLVDFNRIKAIEPSRS
jgi:hypothetical protein